MDAKALEEAQSSRTSSTEGESLFDARGGHPPTQVTVELRRPHTLLLMSTVAGGGAKRGLFTGAIAAALRQSKAKQINVYEMFEKAVQRVEHESTEQTAEMRSTLKKSLIIPLE